MARSSRILADLLLLLLVIAQLGASAPKSISAAEFQSEQVTTGSADGPNFSSTNSKHGTVQPSGRQLGEVVPGEERALPVYQARKVGVNKGSYPHRRINIINATPYRWVRTAISQYQIADWEENWPKYIEPGQGHISLSKKFEGMCRLDTGGEVTYKIEGTCKEMGFQVVYNPDRARVPSVQIKFLGELQTRWTKKGSELSLGQNVVKGGVNFLLAGSEDDFYSRDGPVGWMQEQIKDIGDYPLNEMVMPRSHHTGMNKGKKGVGVVYDATTLTQTRSPYDQMMVGGSRVLDFRPYRRKTANFSAGHFSKIAGLHHGMIGISLRDIMNDINRFLDENPGEMVILDIHDKDSWVGYGRGLGDWGVNTGKFRKFEWMDRKILWEELARLKYRFKLAANATNVHKMTLNSFVGNRKSAVLIHIPEDWARDPWCPGPEEGYVTNRNFPRTAYWSDTDMGNTLMAEQTATLQAKKTSRGGQIHDCQWVLRLASVQYVFPVLPITKLARDAWGRLYGGVWNGSNDGVYPNWISLDAIQSEEAKILAMAMNRCLVAGKCGKLGGKAPRAKPLKLPKCPAKGGP